MPLAAGQCWTYRAPVGFEASRMIIGVIVHFPASEPIVCCSVTGAPRRLPDNSVDTVTIPFLPMSEQAFLASAVDSAGEAGIDEAFRTAFEAWRGDERGLSAFTVPFEGFLDRMIALQMAAIVGEPAG